MESDLPHSARNVDKGIGAVQDSQETSTPVTSFGTCQEPLLNVPFCPALCPRYITPSEHVGFRFEHGKSMLLGNIPHLRTAAVVDSRHEGGQPVEEELQDPVEHLDQERKLLQQAGMGVAGEPRRVGRPDRPYSKDTTSFAFQIGRSTSGRVAVEGRSWGERVRGACYRSITGTLAVSEEGVVLRAGQVHRSEQDRNNELQKSKGQHQKPWESSAKVIEGFRFFGGTEMYYLQQARPSRAYERRGDASHRWERHCWT